MNTCFNNFEWLFRALLFVCLAGFITACAGGGTEVGNPGFDGTGGGYFSDTTQLADYIKDQFAAKVMPMDRASGGLSDTGTSPQAAETQYTTTNIQEVGVDESDVVKSDGVNLFIAGGNAVRIVKAVPANSMQIVSRIPVDGAVDSLYLYPARKLLIVLFRPDASRWSTPSPSLPVGYPAWISDQAITGIMFVDIADVTKPQVLERVRIDGSLQDTRLSNGRLHVVLQFRPKLPVLEYSYDGSDAGREQVIAHNRAVLEPLSLEALTPSITRIDSQGQAAPATSLMGPADFSKPSGDEGGSIVAVTSFNLDDPAFSYTSAGIVSDAGVIYASTKALYTATAMYSSVANDTISWETNTSIHCFDISTDKTTYTAGATINGWVLGQFSLSEYEGVLRIATSTSNWQANNPGMETQVYCLKPKGDTLEVIGKIEHIAPGEHMYAARFLGPRGFLVTFVQVDPLITLDLTDPAVPKIIGELKVPGYSTYIHPLDATHLLAIGKDVVVQKNTPLYQGLQLSIFDISDFAQPKLVQKQIIGDRGTESEALFNHKAFTFWPEKGLLAIPVWLVENAAQAADPSQYGPHSFTGLYVYRVSVENGFVPLGRIPLNTANGYFGAYASWTRGLFIDDAVYAVDSLEVQSAQVSNIANTITALLLQDVGVSQ